MDKILAFSIVSLTAINLIVCAFFVINLVIIYLKANKTCKNYLPIMLFFPVDKCFEPSDALKWRRYSVAFILIVMLQVLLVIFLYTVFSG